MLVLNRKNLKDKTGWHEKGFTTYSFDDKKMLEETSKNPQWIHFGSGNIFRAFIANLQQNLLDAGNVTTGIITVVPGGKEIIEKIYQPYDCLTVLVTMQVDGRMDKKVIGSIAECLHLESDWQRQQDIFKNPTLQIASFTITEKGYKLRDLSGNYQDDIVIDMQRKPMEAKTFMGKIAALAYCRYQVGGYPLAYLSMDNCSHNGDKLKEAILSFAKEWQKNGIVEMDFVQYLQDQQRVAFPCSMIDKITPQPAKKVAQYLQELGLEISEFLYTKRGTCYAPFVNAEQTEYLVVEEKFPNGRPPLETVGVIFTDRETVDKVEKMKVCTCLNPLHTALAVFGCLLGYTLIADEMKNPLLRNFAEKIGYVEGLPVVVDPGVLQPTAFIKEVLEVRLPNANIPDTPQRIAADTSQKVGVRFGKTIYAYSESMVHDVQDIIYIPLAIAGWCRYLLAIDDHGQSFTVSPDPLLSNLQSALTGVVFGQPETLQYQLRPILSNTDIFGLDLYAIGLGIKIEEYMKEMLAGAGAVENTLKKYL